MLEGLVLKSFTSEVAHKLDSKQFVLPKKSTTQALVHLFHLILSVVDHGQRSVRIFFGDFKKGFDLFGHNVIIDELQKLQVTVITAIIRWIGPFLSCLEQCVKGSSSTSSWKRVNGCLPQRTKLRALSVHDSGEFSFKGLERAN